MIPGERSESNKAIHDYFRVDLEVVWDVVCNDPPPLRAQVAALQAG